MTVDEILITSGSQQGIIAVLDAFLEPGDTVITEMFSYAGTLGNLRRHGAEVVGVPLDDEGMRMDLSGGDSFRAAVAGRKAEVHIYDSDAAQPYGAGDGDGPAAGDAGTEPSVRGAYL